MLSRVPFNVGWIPDVMSYGGEVVSSDENEVGQWLGFGWILRIRQVGVRNRLAMTGDGHDQKDVNMLQGYDRIRIAVNR